MFVIGKAPVSSRLLGKFWGSQESCTAFQLWGVCTSKSHIVQGSTVHSRDRKKIQSYGAGKTGKMHEATPRKLCPRQESMEGSGGARPAEEPQILADKLTGPRQLPIRMRVTRGKRKHPCRPGWEGEGEWPFSGHRVSKWEHRNVLEMTVLIRQTMWMWCPEAFT